MKSPNYEPLAQEPETLNFWKEKKIWEKAKAKNKKGENWYFLDGPPYTSGKVHIGTAWNKSLKDAMLRYKRMNGFNVWDRAGYDMHGLPTENAVQQKLNITNKDEIPKFGIKKFVEECKKFSSANLLLMNKDFQRLGVWMDFENAYQSINNEFIEGEWWLIKKAYENNRLYEGERVMHWCAHCSTSLAKHELEYETLKDDSIFLKFRLKDKKNEFLIIWTTTPWTIPYNLGVMVNPEETYVKAKVDKEVWIVASALVNVLMGAVFDKKYEIIEEFKGETMEGWEYIHPLHSELKDIYTKLKEKYPNVHTVVLSEEYVDTGSGSGLVHMAPGCGPEDYEVGHKYNIPPFNNLDESGSFPEEMGKYAGFTARVDDKKFVEDFKAKGILLATTPIEHEYAHCWRCHNGVVFRTTKQWFFKTEDLIPKMREYNKSIKWQPDWAGNRWFDSWLTNLRDNSITRQRYWGAPLPIWKCNKCNNFIVIGSVKELSKYSKVPKDLHRPYIDDVEFPCKKCDGEMQRIPDILDVWIDAGTTSWNCLDYPKTKKFFDKLWPPDFILEGKDQIRGWFNLLMVASMISMELPSFKSCYMHGFVNDAQGRKMSKSLGNYILPEEVIEKYGADTLRYYSISGANPGLDLNYNFDDMKIKNRNLIVLWNLQKFLLDLADETGKNPANLKPALKKKYSIKENYIISRMNSAISNATEQFEAMRINEVPITAESLWLDLSRNYIKMIRDKASVGSEEDKEVVLSCVYEVLSNLLKIFAPIAPFITENIYQNLKQAFGLKEASVHLLDWPKPDKAKINAELESSFETISNVLQAGFSAREKAQLGLKWPVKDIVVVSEESSILDSARKLEEVLKEQLNVKKITVMEKFNVITKSVKADFAKLKASFEPKIAAKIIAHFTTTSPETIIKHIEKEAKYVFKIDDNSYEITKEHVIMERTVPEGYIETEFRGGYVYLNKQRTPELEAEGFARELMRKIQSLRKDNLFDKKDRIALHVSTEMADELKQFESMIKDKVGADKINITESKAPKKFEFEKLETIKNRKFDICFGKI